MEGVKGLYWRRNGSLRYFTTRRIKRFGLGLKLSPIDRLKLVEAETIKSP